MNAIIMTAALALGLQFQFPSIPEPTLPERPPVEAVLTKPLEIEKPKPKPKPTKSWV